MPQVTDILRSIDYPTKVVTLDFETYFDTEYSLRKMSTIEYVTDPRFEFLGVGYKRLGEAPIFVHGDKGVIKHLQSRHGQNFENITIACHNAMFDVLILNLKFGINPPYLIDTLQLARHWEARARNSAKEIAERLEIKAKGDTKQFKGLHYGGMTNEQESALKDYTEGDVIIQEEFLKFYLPKIANLGQELFLARHTLDIYYHPQLQFDQRKAKLLKIKMFAELRKVASRVGLTDKQLRAQTFANVVQEALPEGEHVPTKMGKNGLIPAFAKDDEGMKALLMHPVEKVRKLVEARLAVKSWPLHIKRVQNMINQSRVAVNGCFPVALKYFGGHLGRWSGAEKTNAQNFGGSGRMTPLHPLIGQVKGLLSAPDGFVLISSDYAQIEARVLAWLAGQTNLLAGFAAGQDIYSKFATSLFGSKVRKPRETDPGPVYTLMKTHRGFGKDAILGCVAKGTPVLTNTGFKPIEKVTTHDRLWDGVQWVTHWGIIYRGEKRCVKVKNVWMTPEHEVLTSEGWTTAVELSMSNQGLGVDTENLPSIILNMGRQGGLSPSNVIAPVVESLLRQETTWSKENLHVVMSVLKPNLAGLKRLCPNFWVSQGMKEWLREFVVSLKDAMIIDVRHTTDMADAALRFGISGSQIEQILLGTLCPYLDGMIQNLRSTVLTTIKDMNLVISDLLLGNSKLETRNAICYDILNVGPYKRYQINGMVGSNCGYGMGKKLFYERCRQNDALRPSFDNGTYNFGFIEKLIKTYRAKYAMIPRFWRATEKAFKYVTRYQGKSVKLPCGIGFDSEGSTTFIRLLSGRYIRYPNAKVSVHNDIRYKYNSLWGGILVENIVQATARDILAHAIINTEHYNIVLHCHDSITYMIPKNGAEAMMGLIESILKQKPDWADDLPLDVESKISKELE